MPATDPFSRASLASKGVDNGGPGAASKQSVGLARLPGFFLLVLTLVRRIRLLFNAGPPLVIGVRRPPPTHSGTSGSPGRQPEH
jgi:hypothetical protein